MIPLVRPHFPSRVGIMDYFHRCYRSGKFSNFGELFEQASVQLGAIADGYCLPVSSGTSAIEIACRLRFKPGERIAVPDYTHIGTVLAVKAAGCVPVLCATESDWLIGKVPGGVSGAVVVSPFGYPVNTEFADAEARRLGIGLVYDFAGAWGMFPDTEHPVCYSLHATKNFSCGEGGIVRTRTLAEWERARWMTNFCNEPDRSVKMLSGYNHKVSELLCAVILAHLDNHEKIVDRAVRKATLVERYASELKLRAPSMLGGAPSMCVLEGFDQERATRMNRMGFEVKQYYPQICAETLGLDGYQTQASLIESRFAFPSDVTDDEFKLIVKAARSTRCS